MVVKLTLHLKEQIGIAISYIIEVVLGWTNEP